jgi:hypothetical protein
VYKVVLGVSWRVLVGETSLSTVGKGMSGSYSCRDSEARSPPNVDDVDDGVKRGAPDIALLETGLDRLDALRLPRVGLGLRSILKENLMDDGVKRGGLEPALVGAAGVPFDSVEFAEGEPSCELRCYCM